ncbi:MAG TPA: M20/M25/M40 family metallo-hydrolase [Candidatus Binatia bacterium]|jgi:carboxypeptidase Q
MPRDGAAATAVPSIDATKSPLAAPYVDVARRIRDASLASDRAFERLGYLTDKIGPRLSGSTALEHAVQWARDCFVADGQANVTLEPVQVPHWVRGAASATVVTPVQRTLSLLALGGSVATAPQGLTAPVMVVGSFDELESRKAEAKGKIVLFDHPMASQGSAGRNYGEALPYRTTGAMRAAPLGARAVLVRSLTARSLGSPHTGYMRYPDPPMADVPKIPAAAISVEDAELLHRLVRRGDKPFVHLAMSPRMLPDAKSANVLAEIPGRDLAQEVVVIGAHLDSWDVGQGAQDDGAGVVVVMEALATLRKLGLEPRRTIRAVLFTNEENGVHGAAQYEADHRDQLSHHVAAFEIDSGAGAPRGFMTDGDQPFLGQAREIASLLAPVGADTVLPGFSGEDVSAMKPEKVPLFGVLLDGEHYFDVHHSVADTLDKIDPAQLRKTVAALATMAFVVADREDTWSTAPAPAAGR